RAIVPPGAAIRQMRYQISPVIGRDAIVIRTSPRSLSDDHDVTDYAESSLHEGNPMPLSGMPPQRGPTSKQNRPGFCWCFERMRTTGLTDCECAVLTGKYYNFVAFADARCPRFNSGDHRGARAR